MKHFLVALLFAFSVCITLPGVALAGPDLPEPPHLGDLPRPPDPPGPAPRPPAPGKLPHVDGGHSWWDPLGLFDDGHHGRGHDKHDGKKQKHHGKHD